LQKRWKAISSCFAFQNKRPSRSPQNQKFSFFQVSSLSIARIVLVWFVEIFEILSSLAFYSDSVDNDIESLKKKKAKSIERMSWQ